MWIKEVKECLYIPLLSFLQVPVLLRDMSNWHFLVCVILSHLACNLTWWCNHLRHVFCKSYWDNTPALIASDKLALSVPALTLFLFRWRVIIQICTQHCEGIWLTYAWDLCTNYAPDSFPWLGLLLQELLLQSANSCCWRYSHNFTWQRQIAPKKKQLILSHEI